MSLKLMQSQRSSKPRTADLESACLEMKDTLLTGVKSNLSVHNKLVDLESRSRRNNLRIYGVPENKEGRFVIEFVTELFKNKSYAPGRLWIPNSASSQSPNPKVGYDLNSEINYS